MLKTLPRIRYLASMTFLYFGYGSNLLHERLLLANPSAKFVTTAELKNHALTFSSMGVDPKILRWRGGAASITESPGESVWGCVWRLESIHLQTLDKQENVYDAKKVDVETAAGDTLTCRTYQLPESLLAKTEYDCRPSPAYMDIIVRGAKQNQLPGDYIYFLESVETNRRTEKPEVYLNTLQLLQD